jgi:hypothetical protein
MQRSCESRDEKSAISVLAAKLTLAQQRLRADQLHAAGDSRQRASLYRTPHHSAAPCSLFYEFFSHFDFIGFLFLALAGGSPRHAMPTTPQVIGVTSRNRSGSQLSIGQQLPTFVDPIVRRVTNPLNYTQTINYPMPPPRRSPRSNRRNSLAGGLSLAPPTSTSGLTPTGVPPSDFGDGGVSQIQQRPLPSHQK